MMAGGVLGWFLAMPLIYFFGNSSILPPASAPISELGAWGIWSSYIRYIGAGAVAAGGIISLIKSLPTIIKTFKKAVKGFGHKETVEERTNRDLPSLFLLILAVVIVLAIWIIPVIPVGLLGAIIIVVFGFFFAMERPFVNVPQHISRTLHFSLGKILSMISLGFLPFSDSQILSKRS